MEHHKKGNWFERFAIRATHATGSNMAFLTACVIIIVWLLSGPFFHYSDTWQLVINTGTTIITFLMVFLIQKTQNKDAIALQIKLNELVAANAHASNRIVSVEDLTEEELMQLHDYYARLVELTKKEKDLKASHSIEDTDITKDEMNKIKEEMEKLTKKQKIIDKGQLTGDN